MRGSGNTEMNALNLVDGNVSHRPEIIELLNMAIEQEYQFSYISVVKSHVASHPIKLLSVNVEDATLDVDSEEVNLKKNPNTSMIFRAQCGGISIIFKSRMAESAADELPNNHSHRYKIELPYTVRCIQLRRSVRVNLKSLSEEVPVVLYSSMGERIDGEVIDISTSGAKFRVKRNLAKEFKDFRALETCRIKLPNNSVLQAGAELMTMNFNQESGTSTLGCQFVDMQRTDEDMLAKLVNNVLEQAQPPLEQAQPPLELAIAS